MTLNELLASALLEARKKQDKEKLSILQVLLSEIKKEQIKDGKELDDESVQKVIARQVKQIKDALVNFESAKRDDLITKTNFEIEVLESFLPEQLSDEELDGIIKAVIQNIGAEDIKDIGKVMGQVMGQVQGKANGARVKQKVQQMLTK